MNKLLHLISHIKKHIAQYYKIIKCQQLKFSITSLVPLGHKKISLSSIILSSSPLKKLSISLRSK
jgi:hypothetical protein